MKCTARSQRTGEPCRAQAMTGKTVCRNHGGLTPSGKDSPHWVHGKYSKALPKRLLADYERALSDPELLSLRDDIALIDARLRELLKEGNEGPKDWKTIHELQDLQRKMVRSETQRLKLLDNFVPLREALNFLEMVRETVLRYVPDEKTRQQIDGEIQATMDRAERRALLLTQREADWDSEDDDE